MSIIYAGATRTNRGVERVRAYARARQRARTAVATFHHDEYAAVFKKLAAGHPSHTREYKAAQAAAHRAIAARYPEDFARLLEQQLFAEKRRASS